MACLLTTGRKVPCKNAVGGIKTFYFADFGTLGTPTISGQTITAFSGTPVWYQYDVKGVSNLDIVPTSSRENGTTFYESTATLDMTFLDPLTFNEIKLLATARPYIVVEDYNENFLLLGLEHGTEFTTGNIVVGTAMSEKSGYTLNFVSMERNPPYFVVPGTVITSAASTNQIDPVQV